MDFGAHCISFQGFQGLVNMQNTGNVWGEVSIPILFCTYLSINIYKQWVLKGSNLFGSSHVETQLRSPLSAPWPWLDAIATGPGDLFPEAPPLFPHAPIVPSKPKQTQMHGEKWWKSSLAVTVTTKSTWHYTYQNISKQPNIRRMTKSSTMLRLLSSGLSWAWER